MSEHTATIDAAIASEAGAAYAAGEHGNFRGVESSLATLSRAADPLAAAWTLALRALRWSFDSTGSTGLGGSGGYGHGGSGAARRPESSEARRFIAEPDAVRQVAARACSVMERVCLSSLDVAGLGEWIEVHAALEPPVARDEAPLRDVALWSARLWRRFFDGDAPGQEPAAKALFEEASRRKLAPQVIESTALRALIALSSGSIPDAVELARRASRMAQSEALPQLEYLANLTLARVRRYSGRPHLALHILSTLARVAPASWSGWIGWETLLGGGEPQPPIAPAVAEPHDAPAVVAQHSLAALLRASRAGAREPFVDAAATLARAVAFWPDLARESETLVAALDPLRPVPPAATAWFRGDTVAIPCGLHGIGVAALATDDNDVATVLVTASPGAPGRRILRPALAFAPGAHLLAREPGKSAAGGVRTETGLAALALAGEDGQTREAFFHSVYGFPFVAHRHQAVLDVLCMRMRSLLGDAGEIRRDLAGATPATAAPDETTSRGRPSVALSLLAPIIVPDMRCALPMADRVLRALAKLGTTSASGAADALRMPLRTVQAVLQELVAEGACSIEREGRRVSYRVEDTTFTEVTSA